MYCVCVRVCCSCVARARVCVLVLCAVCITRSGDIAVSCLTGCGAQRSVPHRSINYTAGTGTPDAEWHRIIPHLGCECPAELPRTLGTSAARPRGSATDPVASRCLHRIVHSGSVHEGQRGRVCLVQSHGQRVALSVALGQAIREGQCNGSVCD